MSYRQSSYEPNAYEQPGPPLRPYNWVQWTGAAFILAGLVILAVFFAGQAGVIAPVIREVQLSTALTVIGMILVYSRRMPGTQLTPETRRKRLLIILAAVVIAAISAALAFFLNSQGA